MISRAASLLAALLLASGVALAQTPGPPDGRGPPESLEPDAPGAPELPAAPPPSADGPKGSLGEADGHAKAVDELLGRLAKTDDQSSAGRIAAAVQAIWTRSGSDTVDLLVSRSFEAQRGKKIDVAVKLMDEAVGLRPDYAEGWNRRATLHFLARDFDQAMADIHETLIREPRHFGAWVGLGRILRESNLDRQALAAYRRALALYPAIKGLKREIDELTLKVEGQPI